MIAMGIAIDRTFLPGGDPDTPLAISGLSVRLQARRLQEPGNPAGPM